MKRKLFFLLTAFLAAVTTWAAVGDTFTANNLDYTVTSESPKTAELTGYVSKPKGALAIPAVVNGYSVTAIGNNAFRMCTGMTSVTIPEGVTTIGYGAFGYCTGLTSVIIPEGVTTISSNAFNYCTALTSVNIPDGVTSIGSYAFCYCSKMTSINIPEGVTSIGENAFSGCTKLEEISIPGSVKSIGNSAFESCRALKTVNVYAPALTSYGSDTFKNAYSAIEIKVFSEYEDAYKAGWSAFSSKIADYSAEELTVKGVSVNPDPSAEDECWSTYYHPASNVKVNTAGVEIYIATLSEDNAFVNLTLIDGNIIKAGQAVMLKAEEAGALSMELTPDAATGNYSANDLKGGTTVATGKVPYTLAAKNDHLGFYKFVGSALNANKAHLELPALSATRQFIALDEDDATGIELVQEFKSSRVQDDAWYDLNGRKVNFQLSTFNSQLKKGVYIHNGRKEVVR